MTTDNQKKYEEAAGQYASNRENLYNHIEINAIEAFKAGASFAEKDSEAFIQALKKMLEEKDDQMALQHEIHKNAEKEFERWRKDYDATMLNNLAAVKEEAHNSAIDKCINAFKTNKGVLSFEELKKLKI